VNPGQSTPKSAVSVVDWAEAVLSGGVLMLLQERREATPTWGYLNLLAHNDLDTLIRVREFNRQRQPLSSWGTVVWELIVELIDLAGDARRLQSFQRNALVPLELAVWSGEEALTTPEDLARVVRTAFKVYLPN
jgi:hypothetical protein